MEDIIDLIATDSAASEISDKIKDVLFGKATEKIDALRPEVADAMFGEHEEIESKEEEE